MTDEEVLYSYQPTEKYELNTKLKRKPHDSTDLQKNENNMQIVFYEPCLYFLLLLPQAVIMFICR